MVVTIVTIISWKELRLNSLTAAGRNDLQYHFYRHFVCNSLTLKELLGDDSVIYGVGVFFP